MTVFRITALVIGALASTLAWGQSIDDSVDVDAEPVILVASENLADPVYARTVLIAKPVGGQMHVGIILNKQTDRTLASLFPEHEPSKLVQEKVFFGGPMSRTAVAALTQVSQPSAEGVISFSNDLYFVLHVETIDSIIEKAPNAARYFVGNVIWRPGELDAELERGLWDVLPMSSDIALRKDIQRMWRDLHEVSSLQHARARPADMADRMYLASVPAR